MADAIMFPTSAIMSRVQKNWATVRPRNKCEPVTADLPGALGGRSLGDSC